MSWLLDQRPGGDQGGRRPRRCRNLWWQLATIISCGTLAAVLIPEFTKVFTSSHSKHVHEIVTASREGGASLTILSGIVAGNFSAFWKGMLIAGLMAGAYFVSLPMERAGHQAKACSDVMGPHASIFAFGLVAFGFLCMGPVNIAVDSYGPVTDNAQSIFELAQTEHIPGIKEEIKRDFGFEPDFVRGKHYLEANDSAGNTFKATAKPVLIGTAVVGATTMIFAIILLLGRQGPAAPQPDRRPGAARLHLRRLGDLLVLRRVDAGRHHRRLLGPSSSSRRTWTSTRKRPTSRTPRRSSASAPNTPRRACGTSSSP